MRYTSQVVDSLDQQLNEVKPLLYAVLKMALTLETEEETEVQSQSQSHLITTLDDFLDQDPDQQLLIPLLPGIYKPVEMIARIYV